MAEASRQQLQAIHLTGHKLQFEILAGSFAICRMPPDAAFPVWASSGGFVSLTRTADELSVVCPSQSVPAHVQSDGPWTCFKLKGPFPFTKTGVLASFLQPLAEAGIPIFAVSTFDTDYVLVKEETARAARDVLLSAGHQFIYSHV